LAYVITSPCLGEKSADCVEVCPVDCITEGEDMFFINPDVCIDCGACAAVCPVDAIHIEDELPENQKKYLQLNQFFFSREKI